LNRDNKAGGIFFILKLFRAVKYDPMSVKQLENPSI